MILSAVRFTVARLVTLRATWPLISLRSPPFVFTYTMFGSLHVNQHRKRHFPRNDPFLELGPADARRTIYSMIRAPREVPGGDRKSRRASGGTATKAPRGISNQGFA